MKLRTIAFIGLLAISLTACSREGGSASSSPAETGSEQSSSSQPISEAAPEDTSQSETSWDADNELPVFIAADDHVEIRVELDKPGYDKQSVIGTTLTITNLTGQNIVYVQGSSASVIPDALKYHLGDLAAMFYPEFVTMDYSVQVLDPGLSLRYQLDFVPYISNNDTTAFGVDKELSDFQTAEFTAAAPGEVKGTAAFTYVLLPEGEDTSAAMLAMEENPSHILELEFATTIVE